MDKYFGDIENSEYFARFATDALRMALIRWLSDPGDIPPSEVAEMAKRTVFAIADRCYSLYPEEIEKYKRKMRQ